MGLDQSNLLLAALTDYQKIFALAQWGRCGNDCARRVKRITSERFDRTKTGVTIQSTGMLNRAQQTVK
jgi:hypothetical protein